jgi:hypothetical protein
MPIAFRRLREGVRRHARVVAGIAVNILSGYSPPGGGSHFTSQPIGVKHADDCITDFELIDPVPDRSYLSSAIGQRNATVGDRWFTVNDKVVAKVNCAGTDPDLDFTWLRFWTVFLEYFEIFQACRRSQPNQLHI